jgi:hypothetical protein
MLTAFDDYPYHQIAAPFDETSSSDLRFFDRYWFAVYDPANRFAFNAGLGVYRNMDTMDGFAAVVVGKHQHNVRVSRRLRPDWERLGSGPWRLEIVEPMRVFRMVLEENEQGTRADLVWTACTTAFEEAAHQHRRMGWSEKDYRRYYQFGSVQGYVEAAGQRFESRPEGWWGFRDRSFGVRPGVGGQMPKRGPAATSSIGSSEALLIGFAFRTDAHWGCWQFSESADGETLYVDGVIFGTDGETTRIVKVEHDLEFEPGTLAFAKGTFVLTDSTGKRHSMAAQRFAAFSYLGYGYLSGYWDAQGLGAYRGDACVEVDRYDLNELGAIIDESGKQKFGQVSFLETPSQVTYDGEEGLADGTAFVFPTHSRYGAALKK